MCYTNTLPIVRGCKLPDNILSTIFCQATKEALWRRRNQPPVAHTALSISHTCRHFRTVAMDCQEMWRYIDFKHTRMTVHCARFFADRAKTALSITLHYRFSLEQGEFLLGNIDRVSELYITSGRYFQKLPKTPRLPFRLVTAPILKILRVFYNEDIVFALQGAPCLTTLDIQAQNISSTVTRFRHLKNLTLCDGWGEPQPLFKLMGILRLSPDLEELSLMFSNQKLISTSENTPLYFLCALRKLKKLFLDLLHTDIYLIIRSISTPDNMVMELLGNGDLPTLPFLPTDPRCLPCLHSLHALSVLNGSDGIYGWRNQHQDPISIGSRACAYDSRYNIEPYTFKEICTSRWAQSITKVYMNTLSHDFIPALLGLKNLHTLVLGESRHSGYDILLQSAIDHHYPAVYPSLRAIGFDMAVIKPSSLVNLLSLFPRINGPVRFTGSWLYLTSQDIPTAALQCLCKFGYTGDIIGVLESTDAAVPSKCYSFREGYWARNPALSYPTSTSLSSMTYDYFFTV